MESAYRQYGVKRLHVSILGTVLGLVATMGCERKQAVEAKQDPGPVKISAASVSVRTVQRVVESVGTLFPFDETIISAEIEGRVDQVKVDLGDQITQGQILVHISDEEQRYLLAQNEAQLRMSMERLGLKNENDKIKDVRETSEVRKAQADLFDAEQHYKRVRTLVDQGIGSQADMDQAQSRYKVAQATHEQSMNTIRNLMQEVDRFRASVDLQRKKLRDATVIAPFTGHVKDRQVTVGQVVRANTPLLTLVKIDPIRLKLEVPERLAPWVKNGQMAEISVEAFEGKIFKGKVWRIAPTVDQTKRTFVVEALIDNPSGALKPGSYARAKLPTDRSDRIKLVPVSAVNYVFGSNKAYIVKNRVIQAKEVKLGDRFDNDVEIISGVEEGDVVATSQLPRLDSGTRVEVVQQEKKAD